MFGAKEESRRSFGYKGGVTRGREDHPQGEDWTSGKLMLEKRGSPITPYFALRVIRIEGGIPPTMVSELLGRFRQKNAPCSK